MAIFSLNFGVFVDLFSFTSVKNGTTTFFHVRKSRLVMEFMRQKGKQEICH
jgi:hypothetical protein